MVIKVLSLWEPWATAMRKKLKRNETRSWATRYRGWLAIQSAKKEYKPRDYSFEFNRMVQGQGIWPHHLATSYGKVLCICKLVGCEPSERIRDLVSHQEREWGNYDDGRFILVTCPNSMIELAEPIPLVGHQGMFNWTVPPEVERALSGK